MTKEDFQRVKIGDTLIEGNDHTVVVQNLIGEPQDRIEYYERGYYHEVNYEYLNFPLTTSWT